MIKVKLHANWAGEDQHNVRNFLNYLCTEKNDYKWKDIYITDKDDYDYFVIFNYPLHEDFDPAKTIVFQAEPEPTMEHINATSNGPNFNFYRDHENEFFKIFDKIHHFSVDGAWKLWIPFSRLRRTDFAKHKPGLSTLTSSAEYCEMHSERLNFIKNYLYILPWFDHYGRGDFPPHDRFKGQLNYPQDAYMHYKYTFNCERFLEENYFTDKIRDPILCGTLCFYCGCPNIEDFIDPRCFIPVDIFDPEKSLSTIITSVKSDEWNKRKDFIKKEKLRIMEDLNPLNIIWSIIHNEPIRLFKDIKDNKEINEISTSDKMNVIDDLAISAESQILKNIGLNKEDLNI